jgi:predicted lysophospholipase L1 biosynthesis ABC-type transport system permease subunit
VVIVSEAMVRRYWPDGNAIGQRIRYGPDPRAPWMEIVGVVADVSNDPATLVPEMATYEPFGRAPWNGPTFLVRTSGDPAALAGAVRRALAEQDPRVPLQAVTPLATVVAERLAPRRLPVLLMAAFGALALLLASVGVYAMFAAMATAREREFGVRLALGSSRGRIAALVLRQGGAWMALGLAGGAAGVVVVTRLLRDLLYGVAPFDPVALGASAALLIACAAAALLGPVRRATRADPIAALR